MSASQNSPRNTRTLWVACGLAVVAAAAGAIGLKYGWPTVQASTGLVRRLELSGPRQLDGLADLMPIADKAKKPFKFSTKADEFPKDMDWLNTGGPEALNEAADLVVSFDASAGGFVSDIKAHGFHCSQKMLFHGNALTHSWGQPYQIWASDPPPDLPSTIGECTGLFQLVTVSKGKLDTMKNVSGGNYPGWPVQTRWTAPNNFFSVDLNRMMPEGRPLVHATVSIGYGAFASVWPNPTPKYQVRLFP